MNVPSAREFATETYQDPANMREWTDLGWWTYSKDQPFANLSNVALGNSRFSATASSSDPNITILDTASPVAVGRKRTGNLSPIDANTYRTLAVRMRLSGSPGVRVSDGQVMWTSRSIYESAVSTAGSFWTYGGWQMYLLDIPSLGLAGGTSWQGLVRWLRLDPTIVSGSAIEIDWIRLVSTSNAATHQTITWSGGGAVDIYLDDDRSEANGTLGLIAKNQTTLSRNVTGGSFTFQPGAFPRGDYYVAVRAAGTSNALRYSSGYYRVGGTPTLEFTSPSPEGSSDDFATARLGNAWDMNSTADVDYSFNLSGLAATTLQAENTAGTPLGAVPVLRGTSLSSGATGDPYVYLLSRHKRGASQAIDTSRYRILTFDLSLPGARDMNNGSVARVVWMKQGESAYNISEDIVVNHRAGANVLDRITLDLKSLALEPGAGSPSRSGWTGTVDTFRIDPHEFTPATTFHLGRVKLAALERTGSSYRIAWDYDDAQTGSTVSLYVDDDGEGFDGGVIAQGIDPSSGGFTWNTAGLIDGREYFIYAKLILPSGTVANQVYAPWPVVGGGSAGGTPAPAPTPAATNPVMVIDTPGNEATVAAGFVVAGWAVDLGSSTGTGINAIDVWAYPSTGAAPLFAGSAQLGISRPDVGGIYGSRFTPSGYGLQVSSLPPGRYQLVVFGKSTVTGTFNAVRTVNVNLQGAASNPQMNVDIPSANQTVGSGFQVAGWALDLGAPTGTGVSTVHVWAYPAGGAKPIFLGIASYGYSRPDVGAAFGSSARTPSGYALAVSGLAPGTYDVVVYAYSTVAAAFNNARMVRINVR